MEGVNKNVEEKQDSGIENKESLIEMMRIKESFILNIKLIDDKKSKNFSASVNKVHLMDNGKIYLDVVSNKIDQYGHSIDQKIWTADFDILKVWLLQRYNEMPKDILEDEGYKPFDKIISDLDLLKETVLSTVDKKI